MLRNAQKYFLWYSLLEIDHKVKTFFFKGKLKYSKSWNHQKNVGNKKTTEYYTKYNLENICPNWINWFHYIYQTLLPTLPCGIQSIRISLNKKIHVCTFGIVMFWKQIIKKKLIRLIFICFACAINLYETRIVINFCVEIFQLCYWTLQLSSVIEHRNISRFICCNELKIQE